MKNSISTYLISHLKPTQCTFLLTRLVNLPLLFDVPCSRGYHSSTQVIENELICKLSTPCYINYLDKPMVRNFTQQRRISSYRTQGVKNIPLFFDSAKYIIPNPSKKNNGDDAAFCTAWHLAVADSVGSWGMSGIDPGQYSREIIERISYLLQMGDEIPNSTPSPVKILKEAYINTHSIVSTTCCLVFLDSWKMQIMTANLGDSGFILYRPSLDKVVCRSQFRSHNFNYPRQLGTDSSDDPTDAEQIHFPVLVDDRIILGTDGLWDNLYEHQIIEILHKSRNSSSAAQAIAKNAFKFSTDKSWNSPFSTREREYMCNTNSRFGGKPDDISVVVAQIRQAVLR